jgi:YidC/Oxa1 family membrane protein insertase
VLDVLGAIGGAIMAPLYFLTSLVLSGFHQLFNTFLDEDSGANWVLSIIGLTVIIRAALIPLFVKQIKSSRNMQLIQPKVKELQKKYGHDRERLGQETMKLYRESGTNPFSACLPLIVQLPIFLSLFRLIDQAAKGVAKGVLSQAEADSLRDASLFGAGIADTFIGAAGDLEVRLLAAVLVLAMGATSFLTQRQLMTKNMPADALSGQYAQQQKLLLYVLPVVFAVGGVAFPIGVLVYWTTSNLWTMGQQFYVIRRNPAPGTPAARAKEERETEKRRRKGEPEPSAAVEETAPEQPAPRAQPRQQPKRQSREQRKKNQKRPPRPPGPKPGTDRAQQGDQK